MIINVRWLLHVPNIINIFDLYVTIMHTPGQKLTHKFKIQYYFFNLFFEQTIYFYFAHLIFLKVIRRNRKNIKMTHDYKFITLGCFFIYLVSLNCFFDKHNEPTLENDKKLGISDFNRYDCKNKKRIGGQSEFILAANNPLWRIDGSWFLCFDESLAPNKNRCNVLSFGVNTDESFDLEMNEKHGCNVYSFDPLIECERFSKIRKSHPSLTNSYKLKINDKWKFYRIGLVGSNKKVVNQTKIGGMNSLENILKITHLKDKVVDVFKIDIEYGEFDLLTNLDIDYACKYFKQFMLETHPKSFRDTSFYYLLKRLDPCFLLFHRDTRFFKGDTWTSTGLTIEYQVLILTL